MSWLGSYFGNNYQTVQIAGVPLPQRRTLNILSGATGADNPALLSTDVTITGGGGGGSPGGSSGDFQTNNGSGGFGGVTFASGVSTFLQTPSGANLASALTSALPASKGGTGLTALGTGVATFLGTPSGANLASALTTPLPISAGGTGNTGAASAMGALNIDWSLSNVFTKTLAAGGNTITFSNQASGMIIVVRLTGASSTVTWPTVKWAGGTPPTQTASGTDVYTFVHDGSDIYGSVVQNMS